jgi:hypothetical protein
MALILNPPPSGDVLATMHFLSKDKVYGYNITPTPESVPALLEQSSRKIEQKTDIPVHDLRGKENQFTFTENGIAILQMKSILCYGDFKNKTLIEKVYCEEVALCLQKYMNADSVYVFDAYVRPEIFDYGFRALTQCFVD